MAITNIKIFAIPAWYPSKNDLFSGIFIKEHLLTLNSDVEIVVLFIAGTPSLKKIISKEVFNHNGINEVFFYFRTYNFSNKVIDKAYKSFFYLIITLYGYFFLFAKFGKPNLIHINVLTRVALIPLFLKFIFKIPYVITEHFTRYLPEDGRYLGNNLHHFLTKIIVSKSSALITVSSYLMQCINSFGLTSKLQYVIPNVLNGVFENNSFYNKKDNGKLNLIHISTLNHKQKNVKGIIDALIKVKNGGRNCCLNIYGGYEPYFSECKAYALKNANFEVIFHGVVSKNKIAEAIAEADLSVVFSNYETQGCVIFESLAVGTPVIASNLPAIAEILNSDLGVLVEKGNIEELANAILNFNESNYNKEFLINYAISNFSQKTIGQKLLDVYIKVLG